MHFAGLPVPVYFRIAILSPVPHEEKRHDINWVRIRPYTTGFQAV